MPRCKFKWIFWDNDGVLVDTEALYFRANQEVLSSVGIDLTPQNFTRISMQEGRSTFVLAREKGIDPETIQVLHTRRNQRYSELLKQGVPVMDRVQTTLQQLFGRVSMAVVTSCRRVHFDLIHQTTGLLPFFEFVITTEDVRHTKPEPEPYLKALARSGCKAHECLVVEDAERGLTAAKAAGIPCVVIPNGYASGGDFSAARRILDGIHQVVDEVLG